MSLTHTEPLKRKGKASNNRRNSLYLSFSSDDDYTEAIQYCVVEFYKTEVVSEFSVVRRTQIKSIKGDDGYITYLSKKYKVRILYSGEEAYCESKLRRYVLKKILQKNLKQMSWKNQ